MADENPNPTPTPDAPPPATPDPAQVARDKAADDRLLAIDKKIAALADTVAGALAPRAPIQGHPGQPMQPGQVPDHFRALLRQAGATDADIDANAPVLVPWLQAFLATDGAVFAQGIQHVRDEIDMVKAARNSKAFPYWSELEDKIAELRDEAQKQGQYLAPKDAYKAAVALDVASSESRIESAKTKARERVAANAGDPSVQDHGTHQGTKPNAGGVPRTALTAEDIEKLPRAERRKLFQEGGLGDLPIR
jgi:hypothetical protein